ncbi:MAG: hypothetical protein GX764_01840 [Firmicutes bacterium]|nr:hypothetical protein [Bacillota bacterium]
MVKIRTRIDTGRKLLVIKDSYAHSFVPFLVNHYAEIHLIDLRFFNDNLLRYVEQNNFTEVLILYSALSFAEDRSVVKLAVNEN